MPPTKHPRKKSTKHSNQYSKLIYFLQEELAVSPSSIKVALKHCEQDPGPLPMVLWQYGLISLEQLDQIYDWLEAA